LGKKYPFTFPFHELDNIILSPHRGASPIDDMERWNEIIKNIQRFASGRKDYLNIVNLDQGY
jgi:phosphoglycerate dehydrogenase-like enzyme